MRLLDLFCGAGGAAMGYHRAGFEVIGVDKDPQPNYPFEFIRMDAVEAVECLLNAGLNTPAGGFQGWAGYWQLCDFDVIHASPPCQARSDLQRQSKRDYAELVPPTRRALVQTGLPYVIENVEGTPDDPEAALIDPIMLCGTMFPGLRVIRHRLFESNVPLTAPPHPRPHPLVFTHDKRKAHYGRLDQDTAFVQVTGGGNATVVNKLDAMGIDWMTGREVNEAIPPAYTEHIGRQLVAAINGPS